MPTSTMTSGTSVLTGSTGVAAAAGCGFGCVLLAQLTTSSRSVVVSVLAFLFMKIGQIRYWAFYFPELLLVLLAGILLIGRYTGYRLSELIRFKTFSDA